MIRSVLLAGACGAALTIMGPHSAAAQCVQLGPSVTCTGIDTDGFASPLSALDIEVLGSVVVENSPEDALDLGGTDNQSVTNNGEIFSESNRGIDTGEVGDGLTVDNFGLIDGFNDAIRTGDGASIFNAFGAELFSFEEEGIDGQDDLSVENAGLIDAGERGIEGENNAEVINTATGVIFAVDDAINVGHRAVVRNAGELTSEFEEGVDAGNDLDFINSGFVDAGHEGVEANHRATIANTETGFIGAIDDGIQVNGDADITNEGAILSLEDDGIDVDSGIIRNLATGAIGSLSVDAGGIDVDETPPPAGPGLATLDMVIENAGLIFGDTGILVDDLNTRSQTIINSGAIVGFGGTAVDLGNAEDFLVMIGLGVIDGDALFGDGDDVLDVSLAEGRFVGGFNAFYDGGREIIGDIIDFGPGITVADLWLFDDRDPNAIRIGFNGAGGPSTLRFTDFELARFGSQTIALSSLSGTLPVPLPATAGYLLLALGALGVARRWKP